MVLSALRSWGKCWAWPQGFHALLTCSPFFSATGSESQNGICISLEGIVSYVKRIVFINSLSTKKMKTVYLGSNLMVSLVNYDQLCLLKGNARSRSGCQNCRPEGHIGAQPCLSPDLEVDLGYPQWGCSPVVSKLHRPFKLRTCLGVFLLKWHRLELAFGALFLPLPDGIMTTSSKSKDNDMFVIYLLLMYKAIGIAA